MSHSAVIYDYTPSMRTPARRRVAIHAVNRKPNPASNFRAAIVTAATEIASIAMLFSWVLFV